MRFEAEPSAEGKRLDSWLAEVSGLSRSEIHKIMRNGLVLVDGGPALKSTSVKQGQIVEVSLPEERSGDLPQASFDIRYEDADMAVVFKPAGVVVHPAPGNVQATLVEALARRMELAPAAGEDRPGIVHRLDKDTSGLLMVAKSDLAYHSLVEALSKREITRIYSALAIGQFELPTGRIEAPIGRLESRRTEMGVVADGRQAVTEFRVIERFPKLSLLEVTLQTGRTHQIRVHLAHIAHPVVGDPVYGKTTTTIARQIGLRRPFLHAGVLRFRHPLTGAPVDVEEPLPSDLTDALEAARSLT